MSIIKNNHRMRASRLPSFMQVFLKDTTSFLFSNFPNGWNTKDLWVIFMRYANDLGRVADVYVPGRKDRKGSNFGFVRFKDVKDVKNLLARLNTIWFGSFKLRVSLAVEKGSTDMRRGRTPTGGNNKGNGVCKAYRIRERHRPKEMARSNMVGLKAGVNRTFKEALMQNHMGENVSEITESSGLVLEVKNEEWEWLGSCAVGELMDMENISKLQEFFWNFGLSCELAPLGGKRVLVKAEELELLKVFIEDEKDYWSCWLSSLVLWTPEVAPIERYTWVRIIGLPLQAWNIQVFKEIGDRVGSFLKVDRRTSKRLILDKARILISVPNDKKVLQELKFSINGIEGRIRLEEEVGSTDVWWEEDQQDERKLLSDEQSDCGGRSATDDSLRYWKEDCVSVVEETEDFLDDQRLFGGGAGIQKEVNQSDRVWQKNVCALNVLEPSVLPKESGVLGSNGPKEYERIGPQKEPVSFGPGPSDLEDEERTNTGPVFSGLEKSEHPLVLKETQNSTDLIHTDLLKRRRGKWIWDCFPKSEKIKFISRCKNFNKKAAMGEKIRFEGRSRSEDSFANWSISDQGILTKNKGFFESHANREVNNCLEFGKLVGFDFGKQRSELAARFTAMEQRDEAVADRQV